MKYHKEYYDVLRKLITYFPEKNLMINYTLPIKTIELFKSETEQLKYLGYLVILKDIEIIKSNDSYSLIYLTPKTVPHFHECAMQMSIRQENIKWSLISIIIGFLTGLVGALITVYLGK